MQQGVNLRRWQRAALESYVADGGEDFQLTATPGAGKTTFALVVADYLLKEHVVEQIVIVAPTDHLRHQWARNAASVGLAIDPALTNATTSLRRGFVGYSTTYAQVASAPARHMARATTRPTLVILDEIHHAGDGLTWGEAIQFAFTDSTRRLTLSGTPFRTKPDERIPFVRYDADGDELTSVADFTYGYREALADGVVRPVVFAAYSGESRWLDSAGEVVAAALGGDPEQTKRETELAWRTALDPQGDWVPHVIAAMDDRVTHQRAAGITDAAGLILASDQDAARAYARIVHEVTGHKPVLVLSDDPTASAKIHRFRDSDDRFAVCVRMISEGCDIPRATAITYLTSYQTPLFFTQAIGRVVRARTPHEVATVFLPAVPSLMALAAEIEEQRNHVVQLRSGDDGVGFSYDIDLRDEVSESQEWQPLSAEARFSQLVHSGKALTPSTAEVNAESDDFLGLPGLLTPEQTALVLARRDEQLRKNAKRPRTVTEKLYEKDQFEILADLRRELNAAVSAVSTSTGEPHSQIHVWTREQVAGPASSRADADLIRLRIEALRSRMVRTTPLRSVPAQSGSAQSGSSRSGRV